VATLRCQDQTFENIQAIVFDKDGTLANVEAYLKSLGQKRARLVDAKIPGVQEPLMLAFGLESAYVSPTGLLAVGSRRENEIAAAAFQDAEGYLKPKAVHTPVVPNLGDWLSQLQQSGLLLGILSADTTAHVKEFVETYGLSAKIAAYQGDDGEGPSKPDPRFYEGICRQLNVTPEQTVMIGDSTLDMQMARAAGSAGCVGVTWGWQRPVAIAQATCILNKPEELLVL
jgi:phosphoglycolate phosphatase